MSKLLLAKISKDVIDRDRGSLTAPPRVVAAEQPKRPAAVEETPTASTEAPAQPGRGKLLQFLKKGGKPGAETPAHPAASAANPPLEPAGPFSQSSEPDASITQSTGPAASFSPPTSMQPDETVLTSDDLIPLGGAAARRSDPEPGFSAGEIEREADYGSRIEASASAVVPSGDARTVSVPIDLGSLPSGRVRLVFEIRIEVDAESAGKSTKKSSRSSTMMRDLETIPD